MNIHRLRWLTTGVPAALAVAFLLAQRAAGYSLLGTWWGFAIEVVVVVAAVFVFSTVVLRVLSTLHSQVLEQNQRLTILSQQAAHQAERLRWLHEAALALTGELSSQALLQQIVETGRTLGQAQSADLVAVDDDGKAHLLATAGHLALEEPQQAHATEDQEPLALPGLLMCEGKPLRLSVASQHPSLPARLPGHPHLTSLLGIPIIYQGKALGALYLFNKRGAPEFTPQDQETLELFAAHAAVALENARLYQDIQTVAVVSERERIAREMHDSLAQVLGYVSTKTQGIQEMVRRGDTAAALGHLELMTDAARQAYADVREGILALRSTETSQRGILEAIREYAAQFSRQSGIPTEVAVEGDEGAWRLNPLAEVQFLRIVQEALTNVRKHARASRATVRFTARDALQVRIEDNGQGFNPLQIHRREWPHLGLQAMQERAEAAGAAFDLESSPGRGTTVTLTLPPPTVGVRDRREERHAGAPG